jgi:FixJ family two-component response regulator
MQHSEYKIYIIDDDQPVRDSISLLLTSYGYSVETFISANDFILNAECSLPGCILLDIFLRGESGLDLHDLIKEKFSHLPVIFITGHGDVPMSVQAIRKGALNFLQKPVDEKQLFTAVEEALSYSLDLVSQQLEKSIVKRKFDSLTPRESEIFRYVIMGMLNKQIASELNIAEHTVKLHRGKITDKLGVKSVPEMIRLADMGNIK